MAAPGSAAASVMVPQGGADERPAIGVRRRIADEPVARLPGEFSSDERPKRPRAGAREMQIAPSWRGQLLQRFEALLARPAVMYDELLEAVDALDFPESLPVDSAGRRALEELREHLKGFGSAGAPRDQVVVGDQLGQMKRVRDELRAQVARARGNGPDPCVERERAAEAKGRAEGLAASRAEREELERQVAALRGQLAAQVGEAQAREAGLDEERRVVQEANNQLRRTNADERKASETLRGHVSDLENVQNDHDRIVRGHLANVARLSAEVAKQTRLVAESKVQEEKARSDFEGARTSLANLAAHLRAIVEAVRAMDPRAPPITFDTPPDQVREDLIAFLNLRRRATGAAVVALVGRLLTSTERTTANDVVVAKQERADMGNRVRTSVWDDARMARALVYADGLEEQLRARLEEQQRGVVASQLGSAVRMTRATDEGVMGAVQQRLALLEEILRGVADVQRPNPSILTLDTPAGVARGLVGQLADGLQQGASRRVLEAFGRLFDAPEVGTLEGLVAVGRERLSLLREILKGIAAVWGGVRGNSVGVGAGGAAGSLPPITIATEPELAYGIFARTFRLERVGVAPDASLVGALRSIASEARDFCRLAPERRAQLTASQPLLTPLMNDVNERELTGLVGRVRARVGPGLGEHVSVLEPLCEALLGELRRSLYQHALVEPLLADARSLIASYTNAAPPAPSADQDADLLWSLRYLTSQGFVRDITAEVESKVREAGDTLVSRSPVAPPSGPPTHANIETMAGRLVNTVRSITFGKLVSTLNHARLEVAIRVAEAAKGVVRDIDTPQWRGAPNVPPLLSLDEPRSLDDFVNAALYGARDENNNDAAFHNIVISTHDRLVATLIDAITAELNNYVPTQSANMMAPLPEPRLWASVESVRPSPALRVMSVLRDRLLVPTRAAQQLYRIVNTTLDEFQVVGPRVPNPMRIQAVDGERFTDLLRSLLVVAPAERTDYVPALVRALFDPYLATIVRPYLTEPDLVRRLAREAYLERLDRSYAAATVEHQAAGTYENKAVQPIVRRIMGAALAEYPYVSIPDDGDDGNVNDPGGRARDAALSDPSMAMNVILQFAKMVAGAAGLPLRAVFNVERLATETRNGMFAQIDLTDVLPGVAPEARAPEAKVQGAPEDPEAGWRDGAVRIQEALMGQENLRNLADHALRLYASTRGSSWVARLRKCRRYSVFQELYAYVVNPAVQVAIQGVYHLLQRSDATRSTFSTIPLLELMRSPSFADTFARLVAFQFARQNDANVARYPRQAVQIRGALVDEAALQRSLLRYRRTDVNADDDQPDIIVGPRGAGSGDWLRFS